MAVANLSDFTYEIHGNVICIEDQDIGGVSVTNNIENIVDWICDKEDIETHEYLVVYKDSNGTWDGYDYATDNFIHLGAMTREMAITGIHNITD